MVYFARLIGNLYDTSNECEFDTCKLSTFHLDTVPSQRWLLQHDTGVNQKSAWRKGDQSPALTRYDFIYILVFSLWSSKKCIISQISHRLTKQ